MLPMTLRVTLIIGMLCYFTLIFIFIKNKSLLLKYALLWIFAGIVLICMIIFPNLLFWLKDILGIESNMNGLFVMIIGFVIMMLMALTAIVSRQASKIRVLIQANAILEKRVREMEDKMKGESENGV